MNISIQKQSIQKQSIQKQSIQKQSIQKLKGVKNMRNDRKQRNGPNRRDGQRDFMSGGNNFEGHNSRSFGNNNFSRAPREMHKAICSECKKECEVPFKPTEGKPVFCRDCFQKHKPQRF